MRHLVGEEQAVRKFLIRHLRTTGTEEMMILTIQIAGSAADPESQNIRLCQSAKRRERMRLYHHKLPDPVSHTKANAKFRLGRPPRPQLGG